MHLVQLQTSFEHLKGPPDLERVVPAIFRCLSEDEEDDKNEEADEDKEDDKGKTGVGSREDGCSRKRKMSSNRE